MTNNKVVSEFNHQSVEAEAFRVLRTNLQFSAVQKPFKTLLITSAKPSEGKSTLTANLGIVMAQAGFKVIIVDCDLRGAMQHVFFELSNETGLTNVLLGNTELDDIVKDTELPKLKVITSGPSPPNPAELFSLHKIKEVFDKLKDRADIVLVDSPSVLAVADTVVLSSITDGVIMVIRSGKTEIGALRQAKERLNKVEARIIGSVLNTINISNDYIHYNKKNQKKLPFKRFKVSPEDVAGE